MKKRKISVLVILLSVLFGMFYAGIWQAGAPMLKQTIPPKNYVTFNWVNETNKQFWVNNSYLRMYFDGTQGGCMNDIRHISDLTRDLSDGGLAIKVDGPGVWRSSRWSVPKQNVSVSYTQVSPSFARLVVIGIATPFNFTLIYDIADSEAIKVTNKLTFLKDAIVGEIGHEFVPMYMASVGSEVAYVNSTGYINFWNLTGDWSMAWLANYTAGTFPFAENWVAVWNTTRNIAAGMIFLNQSKLLDPLGKGAYIGMWDGSGAEVVALTGKWYYGDHWWDFYPERKTTVSAGSVFEDTVVIWIGQGDYTDVRNLAGMVNEVLDPAFVGAIPQPTVTFGWVDAANKQFWVNNSYLRIFFDGTMGGSMLDLRHKSDLTKDLIDDHKVVVVGPEIGWHASRWHVPLANVNVSYTQVTPSFATLNITGLSTKNIIFTFLYDIADSEAIKLTYKVTFLQDTNITEMGHEPALQNIGSIGDEFACMNNTGYVNIWNLTGDWNMEYLANYTAGTLPLGENWVALWSTTTPLAAGMIFLDQSKLVYPLGQQRSRAMIAVWDGSAADGGTRPVVSLPGRWYQGPKTLISAGTVFEDTVVLWIGTSDYEDVRNKAGTILELTGYIPPPPKAYPPGVGGEISLLDKLALIVPWIATAAIVIVASLSVVAYRKRITKTL